MTKKTKYIILCQPIGSYSRAGICYHRIVTAETFKSALIKAKRPDHELCVDVPYKAIMIFKIKEVFVKNWQNRKVISAMDALLEGGNPEDLADKEKEDG